MVSFVICVLSQFKEEKKHLPGCAEAQWRQDNQAQPHACCRFKGQVTMAELQK
jgi:hypothetical protein